MKESARAEGDRLRWGERPWQEKTSRLGGLRALGLLLALMGTAAPAGGAPPVAPGTLRETGLYADWETKRVRPDVLSFTPQYPLWSDGAEKTRWLWLPPGKAIDARRPDAWEFPVGTRLWKEFRFGGRRVETRLIERTRAGWRYAAYHWSVDEREAVLAPEEGVANAVELAPGVGHTIPGKGDCKACHEGRPTPVLGFSALQLSPDRDPNAPHAEALRKGDVDLPGLAARGLLKRLPAALLARPPRIPARNEEERAVLGYLHGNCGSCHNGRGPLSGLGLHLWHDVRAKEPQALATSVGIRGLFAIPRVEHRVRVAPGAPAQSTLFHRMASRDPFVQMPPLGTKLPDTQALRLVQKWIEDLTGESPRPQ